MGLCNTYFYSCVQRLTKLLYGWQRMALKNEIVENHTRSCLLLDIKCNTIAIAHMHIYIYIFDLAVYLYIEVYR